MPTDTELRFISFRPDLAEHFKSINEEWIRDMFTMEASDEALLANPEAMIIEAGGQVWFAEHERLGVLACCALMPKGAGAFELTKMGVRASARGLKVGEQLLQHVLNQAASMSIERLFLLTSKKCEAAIHLYEKNGFVHDREVMQTYGAAYARCDVAMKYPAIWRA